MRSGIETRQEDRGLRLGLAVGILLCGMASSAVRAETFEGCSWTGPDLDWVLDRTLAPVDLVGSLGSRELINLLHDSGAPISFISGAAKDPEVRFQRSEPTTVRELLDWVMAQTPGYRLVTVSGKHVIYPFDAGYDELLDLGNPREANRAKATFSVLQEIPSKSPDLRGLQVTLRGPFGGIFYDHVISFGGVRTALEHLVGLVAGTPSATFVIYPGANNSMQFGLTWADVIEDLLLEAPKKVEVGTEFQVVPRLILADGTPVTLIGSGCHVHYKSRDESILTIDGGGRAVAIAKGKVRVSAKYENKPAYVKIEVGDG